LKILLRATNWVGDVVISLPALLSLRASFPEAHLSVLCRPWVADLYRLRSEVDEVVVENPRGEHKGHSGQLVLAEELRKKAFDLAVILPTSFNTAYTIFRAGIPERIGYSSELRSLLLTRAVSLAGISGHHEVFKHLRLVEAAGATPQTPIDSTWTVAKREREGAQKILKQAGWDGSPFIAAHAASFAHEAKRWPASYFGAVFSRLEPEFQIPWVVLLGSEKEGPLNADLAARVSGTRVIDLSEKSSLPDVLGILALSKGFTGNDSGIAHLAAAAGTPTVVIFGPTNPEATRPWDGPRPDGEPARIAIVRQRVLCAPCRFTKCPIDHECMTRIVPGDVLSALARVL
jgi:heptosyltransferase-2